MAKTVSISDGLAALLEKRRADEGYASLDAAAEALIAEGLAEELEDAEPWTTEELRALIREAEESGPAEEWDPKAVRAEVLRRYAERARRA